MSIINASYRLLHTQEPALKAATVTLNDMRKIASKKECYHLVGCIYDLLDEDVDVEDGVAQIITNIDMWFTGWIQNPRYEWDARSIKLMTHHLKTIQKWYPSNVPKYVWRATETKNPEGILAKDLIGKQIRVVEPVRTILSFSSNPEYPKTFYKRVRSAWDKELSTSGRIDLLPKVGKDYASIIYRMPVSSKNLVGTYKSCVKFIDAVRMYWSGVAFHLIEDSPTRIWRTGPKLTEGVGDMLRPFIQRQEEVILRLPSNKIMVQVEEVIFNTADLRAKLLKRLK